MEGRHPQDGQIKTILILPEKTPVANPGFDLTPARLVTGLITERGICGASEKDIQTLFER
jgi:methylthioribose-1-phosphate isomerase